MTALQEEVIEHCQDRRVENKGTARSLFYCGPLNLGYPVSAFGEIGFRIAQLGISTCETHDCDFTGYTDDYIAHTERYWAAF